MGKLKIQILKICQWIYNLDVLCLSNLLHQYRKAKNVEIGWIWVQFSLMILILLINVILDCDQNLSHFLFIFSHMWELKRGKISFRMTKLKTFCEINNFKLKLFQKQMKYFMATKNLHKCEISIIFHWIQTPWIPDHFIKK